MFVPFKSLPPSARVWIFQASRPFTSDEIQIIETKLRAFTDTWEVHGHPFETSYSVQYGQFIILAADESSLNASGCSIDSSVRALKELEAELGVDLFDRNRVAFKSGEQIVLIPVKDLKQNFQDGTLNDSTLTFNNLVSTAGELRERWLMPVGDTWLKRYSPNTLAKVK